MHPPPRRRRFFNENRLLFMFSLLHLSSIFVHAENPLFSDMFSPDSIMGTGASTRGPPHSTPPGFSDQSSHVQLSSSGALIALGDFNCDRFADLVMLDSKTLQQVSIMFWDHMAYEFQHRGDGVSLKDLEIKEKEKEIKSMGNILGAHVGDFANDGTLDLLLHDGEQGRLFFGDGTGNFNVTDPIIIPDLPKTSAVMDANADLVPDIFVAFSNGTRGFWVFAKHDKESDMTRQGVNQSSIATQMKYVPWPGGQSQDADGQECIVLDPVSIAFVDLDGDCLADLVIPTSCGLEVWSNPADSGRAFWELSANTTESSDMRNLGTEVFHDAHGDHSMAFADFNSDGTLDIAVPNRNRHDLVVHLNRQRKRGMDELCTRDPDWDLDRRVGLSDGMALRTAKVGRLFSRIEVPGSLHIGDYDLDGLPDILSVDASSTRPMIFRNLGTWEDRASNVAHFQKMEDKVSNGLTKGNSGSVAAVFFDTDMSGRQDILLVRDGNDTRLIWNNLNQDTDSLFFKGTILSGLAYRQEPKPFSPVAGNTLKIMYMERGSRKRVTRVCSQCGQGGLWQLRVCDCEFGLMRIANYIETLWVGAGSARRQWTNLMPNSMAVVWAEDGMGRGDSRSWWMEYFTQRRGSQMLRVSALLLASLVVLGSSIICLQQQEMKQDREEEQERSRLFNFV